jgi:hypothetical protein
VQTIINGHILAVQSWSALLALEGSYFEIFLTNDERFYLILKDE